MTTPAQFYNVPGNRDVWGPGRRRQVNVPIAVLPVPQSEAEVTVGRIEELRLRMTPDDRHQALLATATGDVVGLWLANNDPELATILTTRLAEALAGEPECRRIAFD